MEPMEYRGNVERAMCERATQMHVPINAILELTPLCNMNCDMCYVRLSPQELAQRGRLRSGAEWMALAQELCRAGTLFVLLTGGEPLLHPDFREIYTSLKRMGMVLTVNTNGTLIDEDWADFFARHLPRRVNITLYGKDEETYRRLCHYPDGYRRARRAVKLLTERHVDVKINGSITPENVDDLDALCSIVEDCNTAWKFDTYMYPAARERAAAFDMQSRLSPERAAAARVAGMRRREKEQFRTAASAFLARAQAEPGEPVSAPPLCRAGRSSLVVNWQGMMRPCIMLSEPEAPVFELGFAKAWGQISSQFGDVRMSVRCGACVRRDVCQTCAACAYLETGRFDGTPEYMCRYTEETIRLLEEELSHEPAL